MLVFQDSLLSVSVFKCLYLLVSCFPIVFLYIVTNMFHIWEGRTRKLESLWWIMETSFGNQVWTAKSCLTATKHTKIYTVPLQTPMQVVWIDDGGLWAPWAGPQTWPKFFDSFFFYGCSNVVLLGAELTIFRRSSWLSICQLAKLSA